MNSLICKYGKWLIVSHVFPKFRVKETSLSWRWKNYFNFMRDFLFWYLEIMGVSFQVKVNNTEEYLRSPDQQSNMGFQSPEALIMVTNTAQWCIPRWKFQSQEGNPAGDRGGKVAKPSPPADSTFLGKVSREKNCKILHASLRGWRWGGCPPWPQAPGSVSDGDLGGLLLHL